MSVSVELAHHWQDHLPGDKVDVSEEQARLLVSAGVARPATVSDAKAAAVDPDEAASKKK